MNNHEVIELLKATEIFRQVPSDVLEKGISHLELVHYKRGNLIIRKGEPGNSMYVISSGEVKVHDDDYVVAHMKQGDFFGEMSLLDSGPRSMSVSATEETDVICISQNSFYNILRSQPAVIQNIMAGMAHRLRAQNLLLIDELKSRESELRRQVTEQTMLYKEQKERAEQSEKYKQQFLANMSHEIRTPMNAVMGMTNILLEKNPREDQLKYLQTIQKSSDHLLVIINDILDLSKIEAGRMEVEQIAFSPGEIIDLVQQTLQHKAEEKGLVFKVEYQQQIPGVVMGDPTRLGQILMNLVGNAIKFTEHGSVTLSVSMSARADQSSAQPKASMCFSIIDTGIGMSQVEIERVFETFTQASGDTNRKFGGSGLGLSISKLLVELQGGDISVTSKPGEGSTFCFTIDYAGTDKKIVQDEHSLTSEIIGSMEGIKILLAEDNDYNIVVTRESLMLKIKNISIDVVTDGIQALEKLSDHHYDLILMDVQMPLMDGYEASRKIRSEFPADKNKIPIIALSASVTRADIDESIKAGMNGFVGKPFKANELLLAMFNSLQRPVDKAINSLTIISEKTAVESSDIDLTFLKNFTEGDKSRMKKYMEMFIAGLPGFIQQTDLALKSNDAAAVARQVHAFRPRLMMMGLKEAQSLADTIELMCKEGKVDPAIESDVKKFIAISAKAGVAVNELLAADSF